MKYFWYLFFISAIAVAQQEDKDPYLEVWTLFTDDNFVNSNAHRIASKNWPFTIYSMSGEIVLDEKIIDSVNQNNQTIWQYLNSHGYKNSKKKYLHDFYIERNALKKAIAINRSQLDIIAYKPKDVSYLHAQFYTGITKIRENVYQFDIYVIDYNKQYNQESIILKYIVDIDKETISIIKTRTQ